MPEPDERPSIRALARRKNQTLLTVNSVDMLHATGFLACLFDILARYDISVDLVTTSEVSIALTLDEEGSQAMDCQCYRRLHGMSCGNLRP